MRSRRTVFLALLLTVAACVLGPEEVQDPVVRFETTLGRYYHRDSIPPPRVEPMTGGFAAFVHVQGAYCYEHLIDARFEGRDVDLRIVSSVTPGFETVADCGVFLRADDFKIHVTGLEAGSYRVKVWWIRPPDKPSGLLANWDQVSVPGGGE